MQQFNVFQTSLKQIQNLEVEWNSSDLQMKSVEEKRQQKSQPRDRMKMNNIKTKFTWTSSLFNYLGRAQLVYTTLTFAKCHQNNSIL